MTSKQKSWAKAALRILVSATAMVFVFRSIDWPQMRSILSAADLLLLAAAILLFAASKISSAFRLQVYFRNMDLYISDWRNLKLAWLGMFYNLFLPGGIGGDGYKVYVLHKESGKSVKLLGAGVLIDRISGMAALTFLALVGIALLDVPNWPNWITTVSWVLAALAFPVLYALKRLVFPSFVARFGVTTLFSLVTQALQLICVFFILWSLGLDSQYLEYQVLFLASSVVAVLPFTIGGVGARELTFLAGYQYVGIDKNLAVALSLLFFLITLGVSVFGAFFDVREKKETS